jgi:hypothetical protein
MAQLAKLGIHDGFNSDGMGTSGADPEQKETDSQETSPASREEGTANEDEWSEEAGVKLLLDYLARFPPRTNFRDQLGAELDLTQFSAELDRRRTTRAGTRATIANSTSSTTISTGTKMGTSSVGSRRSGGGDRVDIDGPYSSGSIVTNRSLLLDFGFSASSLLKGLLGFHPKASPSKAPPSIPSFASSSPLLSGLVTPPTTQARGSPDPFSSALLSQLLGDQIPMESPNPIESSKLMDVQKPAEVQKPIDVPNSTVRAQKMPPPPPLPPLEPLRDTLVEPLDNAKGSLYHLCAEVDILDFSDVGPLYKNFAAQVLDHHAAITDKSISARRFPPWWKPTSAPLTNLSPCPRTSDRWGGM